MNYFYLLATTKNVVMDILYKFLCEHLFLILEVYTYKY